MRKTLAVFALLALWGGAAYALPALQLGPGVGTWTYDTGTQTWVTDTNPFSLFAYANAAVGGNGDFAWQSAGASTRNAYLVISAVPMISFDGFDVTVDNGAGAMSIFDSGFGAPPVQDNNDLAPHGIFDTWFEIYEFQFDAAAVTIGDTQPGGTGTGMGHAEEFDITINSLEAGVTGIHMDLFVVEGDGTFDPSAPANSNKKLVNAFAPFSHDAQHVVPEPTTLVLLGVGIMGAGIASRRRRRS